MVARAAASAVPTSAPSVMDDAPMRPAMGAGHRGETDVQTTTRQRRLAGGDIGLGLGQFGGGVVIGLAADRVRRQQRLQPLDLKMRPVAHGHRPLQGGRCRVRLGPERRRIDLEQRLPRPHDRAFGEQLALNNAADLGADLRRPESHDTPRQTV